MLQMCSNMLKDLKMFIFRTIAMMITSFVLKNKMKSSIREHEKNIKRKKLNKIKSQSNNLNLRKDKNEKITKSTEYFDKWF